MRLILILIMLLVARPAYSDSGLIVLDNVRGNVTGPELHGLPMGYYTLFCNSKFGAKANIELQILKPSGLWEKATGIPIDGAPSTNGINFFVDKNYDLYRMKVVDYEGPEDVSCILSDML